MDIDKDGVRKERSRFLSELLGCHRVSHHKMRITSNKEIIIQVATDVSAFSEHGMNSSLGELHTIIRRHDLNAFVLLLLLPINRFTMCNVLARPTNLSAFCFVHDVNQNSVLVVNSCTTSGIMSEKISLRGFA
jgi:hypothetical protein